MNKKFNTILFLLGASVFHVIVFVTLVFAIYVPIALNFPPARESASLGPVILIGALVAAFALAVLIYRGVLGLIRKRVDLDKYFDPVFGKSKDKLR